MSDRASIAWDRMAVEGIVIVVSILLAFAIDAWWDEQQERNAEIQHLARVSSEIEANIDRIRDKNESLQRAMSATSDMMSWMGPNPTPVSDEIFNRAFDRLVRIGTMSLNNTALESYLGVGRLGDEAGESLHTTLSELRINNQEYIEQYSLLRKEHADYMAYLQRTVPLWHGMRYMSVEMPESKFPLDPNAVLADFVAESLFGTYFTRMKIVRDYGLSSIEYQFEVLEQIDNYVASD